MFLFVKGVLEKINQYPKQPYNMDNSNAACCALKGSFSVKSHTHAHLQILSTHIYVHTYVSTAVNPFCE